MDFESWLDKQIRDGEQRGLFDNLAGAGEPLPRRHEPQGSVSWLRNKMREEGLGSEALLPPQLQLRKEIERLPETVRVLPTERAVRDAVTDLNRRIAECLRSSGGPAVPIGPVNPDDVVRRWRAGREGSPARSEPSRPSIRQTGKKNARAGAMPRSRRRWFRLRRQSV